MIDFDLVMRLLMVVGMAAALATVASWPKTPGKTWLVVALLLWLGMGVWGSSVMVYRHFYGRETGDFFRYARVAQQFVSLGIAGSMVVGALQHKECLLQREPGRLSRTLDWLQTAPIMAATLVLVGMSSPWVHYGNRWVPAWSSSVGIQGVVLPGYLLAIAVVVAVACHFRNKQSRTLPLAICVYGILHAMFMGWSLMSTPAMDVGFGLVLTVLGFVALILCIARAKAEDETDADKSVVEGVAS